MADIRINSLPSTATSFNTDDYIAIDGASAGTRRMLAANPPFSDVTLGTSGPSVKSTLSARAPRQGLVFDGTATVTASTVPAIGSGDYTVHVVFKAASPTSPLKLVQVGQSGVPQGFQFGTTDGSPAGRLAVRNGDASAQLFGSTVLTANKWYAATAVRSSGTVTIYLNAVSDGTGTLNTDYSNGIGGMTIHGSTGNYAGTVETVLIYNRALSASEVVALYEAGVPDRIEYNAASNTAKYTSDFSVDTNGWSVTGGTIAGNIDGIGGQDNNLRFTLSGGSTQHRLFRDDYFLAGKWFLVTADIYIPSASTSITSVDLFNNGTSQSEGAVTTKDAWTTLTGDIQSPDARLRFAVNNNATVSADGQVFYIRNIKIFNLGLLLAPDAAQAGGGLVWYDTSGNAANITLPASGVSWNVPFGNNIAASGTNQNITLTPSGTGVVRVPKLSSGATDFSAVIGDSFVSSSGSGRAKLLVGTSAADAEIFVGQGSNNSILLKWVYNATTASAYGSLGTYAGNNRLVIQGDGGNVLVGGTIDGGQKLQVSGTAYVSGDATFAGNITRTRSAAGSTGSAVTDYLVRLGNSTSPSAAGVLASNIGASNFRTSLVLRTTDTSGNAVDAATFDYAGDATFAGSRITLGGSGNGEVDIRRATNSNGSSVAYRTTSTLKWYHGLRGLVNDNWYLQNEVAGNTALFFDAATSDATFGGKITTSAPTGGAGAWELGVANTVSPTAPNRTITIEIGGTVYYLHAKTTND